MSHVRCHVSCVTCLVSHVTFQVSCIMCHVVGVDPNIDVEEGSDGSDVDLRACIEVEGLVTL